MRRVRWSGPFGATLISALLFAACSSDDSSPAKGSGGSAGTAGSGGTAGSAGTSASGGSGGTGGSAFTCGTTACPEVPSQLSSLGISACCNATDQCGLSTPLSPDCLDPDQPGGLDPTCPDFAIAALGFTLPGCCRPDGQCGQLDTNMGIGCMARDAIGEPPKPCAYDPNNNCTELLPVTCDGPEDCPTGKQCCGRFDGAAYSEFLCLDSCVNADAGSSILSEMCHLGQTCENTTYQCLSSPYLPGFLHRCRDTGDPPTGADTAPPGAVNCGATTCSVGEKCCLRTPGTPYCAPSSDPCQCNPSSGTDAGPDSGSGGAANDGSAGDSGAAGTAGTSGSAGASGTAGASDASSGG